MAAPNSFRDPTYDRIDRAVEDRLGLPEGLLSSIRTKGERSNADQVSSAGARTVYQITAPTRAAIRQQYGIDPYSSAENAATGAGLLLRDSLARNNGDRSAAVGEYIGGTDRRNWGPQTRAYINRVTGGGGQASTGGGTAFDRAQASRQQSTGPDMAAVYRAYQNTGKPGGMTAQDAAQYEHAVLDGHVMLPRGAALRVKPAAPVLPKSVVDAYNSHRMDDDPDARAEVKRAVDAGEVSLPRGMRLTGPAPRTVGERLGMGVRDIAEGAGGLVDVVAGPLNATVNAAISPFTDTRLTTQPFRNAASAGADALGLSKPESDTENLVSSINQGGTQGLLTAGGGLATAGAKGATGVIGEALASSPLLDTISGATSGAAQETARQAGAGPVGQVVAGLAGGMVPVGAAAAASRVRAPKSLPDVVADTPRAAVIDESGNLTPHGQDIAARHGATPEEVAAAYEAPPSVQKGTANDQLPDQQAAGAETQTVRRHEGVDYPVEVFERGVKDAEGNTFAKVRGTDTGDVGYVPDAEVIEIPVRRAEGGELPPQPNAPSTDQPNPVDAPEALPATALSRVEAGKELGVDMTRGQATKSFDVQDAESRLRNSNGPEGEAMRQFVAKQTEQVRTAVDEFKTAFDDANMSAEQRGQAVQEAIRELRDNGQRGVTALYKTARELGQEVPLDTTGISRTFEGLMAEADIPESVKKVMEQEAARYGLIGKPQVIDEATGAVTNEAGVTTVKLDDGQTVKFRGEPQTLRLDNAEEFRQVISKQYQVDGPQKLTQELKTAIDNATEEAATKLAQYGQEGAKAPKALEAARAAHVQQVKTFKAKDIVQSIADWKKGTNTDVLKPEQVMQQALAKTSDLKRIKAVLLSKPTVQSKAAWRAIQAHGLAEIFDKATTRNTNAAGEITDAISGAKLRSEIERFGADKLKVLLDPDDFNKLMKLRRVIEDVTIPISGTTNPSGSGNLLMRLAKDVDNQVTAAFSAAGMALGGPAGAAVGGAAGRTLGPAVKDIKQARVNAETLKGATEYTPEQAATDTGEPKPSTASKAGSVVKQASANTVRAFIDTYGSPRILAPVLASTTGAQE